MTGNTNGSSKIEGHKAGCPTIQFNSDINYPALPGTPQLRAKSFTRLGPLQTPASSSGIPSYPHPFLARCQLSSQWKGSSLNCHGPEEIHKQCRYPPTKLTTFWSEAMRNPKDPGPLNTRPLWAFLSSVFKLYHLLGRCLPNLCPFCEKFLYGSRAGASFREADFPQRTNLSPSLTTGSGQAVLPPRPCRFLLITASQNAFGCLWQPGHMPRKGSRLFTRRKCEIEDVVRAGKGGKETHSHSPF
ncbi:uncharacterized protein LOC122225977 [Panthera leo]|uniref:uncharacterized protein LOC122225977 n=1 Tax=Panthera leo TaxID=9689 RepID=UPI001C69FF64|nr:uncharacterized protein LOC122225977 [Panthera leo]